jgi:hypothetical protein
VEGDPGPIVARGCIELEIGGTPSFTLREASGAVVQVGETVSVGVELEEDAVMILV